MTLEQIVEETRQWPTEKIQELVDRLAPGLHPVDSGVDDAWRIEARRRLKEIENGTAKLVDGDVVLARMRKIVGR